MSMIDENFANKLVRLIRRRKANDEEGSMEVGECRIATLSILGLSLWRNLLTYILQQ